MDIRTVYSRRYLIPADCHGNFTRKPELTGLEHIGLEAILAAFVQQYEETVYGEICTQNLTDYTRFNADSVDILDGCYDTYVFDGYAIDCIYATHTGIPVLSCYRLEHPEYDDPFEVMRCVDWMSECEQVLFRLD